MSAREPTTSGPEAGPRAAAPTAGFVTVDADGEEIPVDLAAWIDARDPEPPTAGGTDGGEPGAAQPPATDGADDAAGTADDAARALDEQRSAHEPDGRDANLALGQLVNNTGDDGGAASG